MSRLGIAAWVLAGFCLGIAGFFKFILMQWPPFMIYALIGAGAFVVVSIVKDKNLYWDFLTMRTTKHGMNMGALILLTLFLLIFLNYITSRHNKTFDLTEEKLNTLSDQSITVLKNLKDEVQVKLFFDPRDRDGQRDKAMFRDVVALYQEQRKDIKYEAVNALNNPALAKDFGVSSPKASAYVVYAGRKNRLNTLDEQGMTTALINASREKKKSVYFTKGHGEWPLEPDQGTEKNPDISDFKQALIDNAYEVKPLDLTTVPKVPDDAAVVAIIGPKNIFLEGELKSLREYAKIGGSLLIGVDPGVKHNLAPFLKEFGIEFTNKYIFDALGQQFLNNATLSIGTEFSPTSQATKGLGRPGNDRILFSLATVLNQVAPPPQGFTFDNLVKTTDMSLAVKELPKGAVERTKENQGPHVVAIEVKGRFAEKGKSAPPDQKEFNMIVFGDSDFVMGPLLRQDPNRNLALNTVAALSKDTDLVSIRPKSPKGTNFVLPATKLRLLFWGVYFPLFFLLISSGTVIWFRRRTA
jgi:ABC-type uncharacterized transport system involved in gliding motility auxiliary subunit